jgi:CheY-like chemotaxis protein
MGGGVHVESTPGFGSAFHFTIQVQVLKGSTAPAPTAPVPAEPAPPALATRHHGPVLASESPVRGLRVLLVEDNRVNQALATALLKKGGCVVRVAQDGRRALEALHADEFDLVLMDVCMPEMDGYEATRHIRTGDCGPARKDIYIVAMTANAMEGDREKCLDAGMDAYLSKPIDRSELAKVLERAALRQQAADGRRENGPRSF